MSAAPARPDNGFSVYTLAMTVAEIRATGLGALAPGATVDMVPPELTALLPGAPVRPADVQVFDMADLVGVGLATFLIDGNGAVEAQIEADRARLDALQGFVLIVHGPAPTPVDPRLTLIGRYAEDRTPVKFEPLPNASAKGVLPQGKPPKSDARIGGMVATVVLLILFVFTALLIWFAG